MTRLDALRKKVDRIDANIIKLIAERFSVTEKIQQYKEKHNMPIRQEDREKEHMTFLNQEGKRRKISKSLIQAIFTLLFESAKRRFR